MQDTKHILKKMKNIGVISIPILLVCYKFDYPAAYCSIRLELRIFLKDNIYGKISIFIGMKKVEAIIRAEKMPEVKEHLRQIGIGGMTVSTVSGWSRARELHLQWRGNPVSYDLIPRAKFEAIIQDEKVDEVIRAIVEHARTGEHGDGVIFVSTVEKAINITNLNRDDKGI